MVLKIGFISVMREFVFQYLFLLLLCLNVIWNFFHEIFCSFSLCVCVSAILTRLHFHLLFPFNLYSSSPPPSSSLILSSLPSLYFFHFITFFDYPLLSSPLNTFISCSSPLIFHPISSSFALVFLFSLF